MLLRYNVRILLGNTVWLLVVPIASSQLIVVWQMAVSNTFNPYVAAKTSELLAPLWAALLCAHTLGQEFRSQLAEITFSKPLSVNRIVLLRLAAIFALIELLILTTLGAYYLWLKPFEFLPVWLMGIPSTLFIGMVALVLTALWRNPLLGFGGAALYWALDWLTGMATNPLLSLSSYAESLTVNPLAEHWRINKIVLLIVAVILYFVHGRIVARPTGLRTWRTLLKSAGIPVALFFLVLFSGAAYKLFAGIRHEAQTPNDVWGWYNREFKVYSPFPAAWMFGPAFAQYVDQPFPGAKMRNLFPNLPRERAMRMTRWQAVVTRYPRSRWADHALYELARYCEAAGESAPARPGGMSEEEATATLQKAADYYEMLARYYPNSLFAPHALSRLDKVAGELNHPRQQRWAQETLVQRYTNHPLTWYSARRLAEQMEREGKLSDMLPILRRVADHAPVVTKPFALLFLAQKLSTLGQPQEARPLYEQALKAARDGIAAIQSGVEPLTPAVQRRVLPAMEQVMREATKALEQR